MGKYVITGGNRICGSITIESAKNAVLPILAGSILADKPVRIINCPKIKDVLSMIKILNSLGVATIFSGKDLVVDASKIRKYEISSELTKELRSSVFMLGALVSKLGKAVTAYPGGCEIGLRPIDIHIDGLKKLGVKIHEYGGIIECVSNGVKGAEIYLDFPSVGATENIILASVFCEGQTVIRNAAREPEIADLIKFLNVMGAKIKGGGTATVYIEGVKKLNGAEYKPMSDRIEAGTYLLAAAITGGEIELHNCYKENILALTHKLCNNTCKISAKNDILYYNSVGVCSPLNIETSPYPGFPTDLQSQTMALATVANGTSLITENIFEMRFKHVADLIKMGADIKLRGRTAVVNGVKRLHSAKVSAEDLRGGAALVLAALNAEGQTEISNVYHIERGYLNLVEKVTALGGKITKINI